MNQFRVSGTARSTLHRSTNTHSIAYSATLSPLSSQLHVGKSHDLLVKSSLYPQQKKGHPRMIMRKLGYLGLTAALVFSVGGVAEAKHRHSHSGGSAHSGLASMYGTKGDGYAGRVSASGAPRSSAAPPGGPNALAFGTIGRGP